MNTTDTIKLSDTQMLVLTAAAARVNGSLLPMPKNIRGGASIKVLGALVKKGCAETVENPEEIGGTDYRITRTGLGAIGADPDEPGYEPCNGEAQADTEQHEADNAIPPDVEDLSDSEERDQESEHDAALQTANTSAPPVKTRTGTKQARLIEMLSADGGATVETLMAEFGWQRHTVRGAISGAIKKKLGLTVEVIKAENGDRHYHIPAT